MHCKSGAQWIDQALHISLQVHSGRTDSQNHLIADLKISFWILSYWNPWQGQRCWQNSTESSTTSIDRIKLSRSISTWKYSRNGKRPDQPNSSHRQWCSDGGHVTWRNLPQAPCVKYQAIEFGQVLQTPNQLMAALINIYISFSRARLSTATILQSTNSQAHNNKPNLKWLEGY